MLLLCLLVVCPIAFADDATYSGGFKSGNNPFPDEKPVEEELPSDPPTPPFVSERPVSRDPNFMIEDDDEPAIETPIVVDPSFKHTNKYRAKNPSSPVYGPFKELFKECAPECSQGEIQICRTQSCQHNHGSCHNSGHAVDVMGLTCNGAKISTYTARFNNFAKCAARKKVKGTSRNWKTIWRENTGSRCGGLNWNNARSSGARETSCHWDHVHISMGCRRGGRTKW